MNARQTPAGPGSAADEAAIRDVVRWMVDAWNRGSAEDFTSAFSEDADFVVFEGTHLVGRRAITAFHQRIFDTVVKGSRLWQEVKFVRFVSPDLAVMHAVGGTVLPGASDPSPSRDSMQIFVLARRDGVWCVDALLNARKVTLERQPFWDDFESLPGEAQRRVMDLVASLKASASPTRVGARQ